MSPTHRDTCNATRRERSKLHICELPTGHDGWHKDGALSWPTDYSLDTPRVVETR